MAVTAEMQRRAIAPQPSQKALLKQKIQSNMELLRVASGANSIQGFGRMAIGAIILSLVFSLATLLSVLYSYFAERIEFVAVYLYPLLAGAIIFLFYEAVKYIREGFIMFEQSKGQEDAALEKFVIETLGE